MVNIPQRIFCKFVLLQRRSISDVSLGEGPQPTSDPDSSSSGCSVDRNRITHANCASITENRKLMILEWVGAVGQGEKQ